MSDFDDIQRRIQKLDDRLQADGKAAPKGAEETPDSPERGPLYWFFFHFRRRLFGGSLRFARRHPLLALGIVLFVLYVLVTGRGWYQPGFVFVRRYAVLGLFLLLLLGMLYAWFRRAKPLGKLLVFILTGGLVAGAIFYGVGMVNYLALYVHYQQLPKLALAEVPLSGYERIQPLNAIATLAAQEAMDETEAATLPHYIRRADGRFDFSMAVGPSPAYPLQRLTRDMDEIISVPATAPAPDFSSANRHDIVFDVGETLLFSKRTYSAAVKRFTVGQYWTSQPGEVRYLDRGNGDWVQVVSLIQWKGVVFPRPVFGGVMVIEPREPGAKSVLKRIFMGRGTWIKPEEVASLPWLEGQNLVPERVSRFTAESFRFHQGFLAPFPGYREGDIRIPSLPEDQNAMPFVTWFDMAEVADKARPGLYHYFGMEPYEASKQGLNLSLFVPGDGARTVYYLDHNKVESGLFGSSAVPVKVKESRKNYDWNNNVPVESRPYIRDVGGERRFFWLTTVVTKADRDGEQFIGGSIPDITLTDARHRQVVWVDRTLVADPAAWPDQLTQELGAVWGLAPAGRTSGAMPSTANGQGGVAPSAEAGTDVGRPELPDSSTLPPMDSNSTPSVDGQDTPSNDTP